MKNGKPVIYWDTCVFIAWLKDEKIWPADVRTGINHIFELVARKEAYLVTSSITRAEIFLATLTADEKKKFADVLKRKNVDERSADFKITDRAAELRYGFNIKTPDAIHLATAVIARVDELQTMDGLDPKTGKCNNGMLALNGRLSYRIFITAPYSRSIQVQPNIPPQDSAEAEISQPILGFQQNDETNSSVERTEKGKENDELKTDTAHPTPIQGSDSGRAQGETAAESANSTAQTVKEVEEVKIMFKDGDYVRLRTAPNTRLGTIGASKIDHGHTLYVFRQDGRFKIPGEQVASEFYVLESEIEKCARPSDGEVQAINQMMEKGS